MVTDRQATTPRPDRSTRVKREETPMILLRRLMGGVLRQQRQRQGRTLREVSSAARVSLGYLSEVERGQKEPSSELLASICSALDVPLSAVLREVSDGVEMAEMAAVPPAPAASPVLERVPAGIGSQGEGRTGLPEARVAVVSNVAA